MKHYGNINLNENELQNMVLGLDTQFPSVPKVGRVVFKNKRVYICVELVSGAPTWVPLTNELSTYVHTQPTGSTTWTVTHNLNTSSPLVQIYDTNHKIIIPDEIEVISNNVVSVTFLTSQTGRAVIFHGSVDGSEIPEKSYVHHQTSTATTWVIDHELGYYPIVRVFIGDEEIQPVSIVHNSVFRTTISFSISYVGYARCI